MLKNDAFTGYSDDDDNGDIEGMQVADYYEVESPPRKNTRWQCSSKTAPDVELQLYVGALVTSSGVYADTSGAKYTSSKRVLKQFTSKRWIKSYQR